MPYHEVTEEEKAQIYPTEEQLAALPADERRHVMKECYLNYVRARSGKGVQPYARPALRGRELADAKADYIRSLRERRNRR